MDPSHDGFALQPLRACRVSLWLGLLAIVLGLAIIYWPTANHGFVDWDDHFNLLENPHFRGLGWSELQWAFSSFWGGHYQPLTWISFGFDYTLWELDPRGYHLTNLFLHCVNVVLVGLLARRLMVIALRPVTIIDSHGAVVMALVSAAAFGIHPLRVESVAWVTERRDVLCSVFFFLAILLYLNAVDERLYGRARMRWLMLSVLAFAASLGSKALGMSLPIVLLLLDYFPLGRWTHHSCRRLMLEKVPYFGLSVAFGLAALAAQKATGALADVETVSIAQRFAQFFEGVVFYPRAMLFDQTFNPLHERSPVFEPLEIRHFVNAGAAIVLTVAALLVRKRLPAVFVAWFAFLALVAPVTGIAQSGMQVVADRYSYLSCVSIAMLLGAFVGRWWVKSASVSWSRAACAVVVLLIMARWGYLARNQVFTWRDDTSLWTRAVELGPSATARNNLGWAVLQTGDRAGAARWFVEALSINPRYERARQNLIAVILDPRLESTSEWRRAADAQLRIITTMGLRDASLWHALGFNSLVMADLNRARTDLEKSLEIEPGNLRAWLLLAQTQLAQGDADAAIESCRSAAMLAPEEPGVWVALGKSLLEGQQVKEAHAAVLRALELSPNHRVARELLMQVQQFMSQDSSHKSQ